MPKFRKRPVVIEAEQFFTENFPWPRGVEPAAMQHNRPTDRDYWPAGSPIINTLKGPHCVSEGDWIITGIRGERYPCKPDIFAATYEPVEVPASRTTAETTHSGKPVRKCDRCGRSTSDPTAPIDREMQPDGYQCGGRFAEAPAPPAAQDIKTAPTGSAEPWEDARWLPLPAPPARET